MTRITNERIAADDVSEQTVEHTRLQSVEIIDPVFEETYTAHVAKKSAGWRGWIPDVPEVECEGKTKTELLKRLTARLREVLEVREEAWDKQLEEDIKAGKLDHLREEALEEIKAGRVIDL
jgi:predicted RNase H-like HicB family nuclease